jgi:hypothetical protein
MSDSGQWANRPSMPISAEQRVVHGAEVLLPPVVEQLVVHGAAMGPPLVVEQPMGVKEEPEVCFLPHSCFNCKQDCDHHNVTSLFCTNNLVNKYDGERLQVLGASIVLVEALHTGMRAQGMSDDHLNGLKTSLMLAIGAKVWILLVRTHSLRQIRVQSMSPIILE